MFVMLYNEAANAEFHFV